MFSYVLWLPSFYPSNHGLIIHILTAIQVQPLQRRELRQLLQRGGRQVAKGGVDLADAGAWLIVVQKSPFIVVKSPYFPMVL